MSERVCGGYYIKARKIKGSAIAHSPPYVRELWDYLLREASHKETKYNGFTLNRGQLFKSYKDIRDDLCWYVGYRKERYNENQMKMGMRYLMKQLMITSMKQPRGNLITVLNYDYYQNPKNYEATNGATNDTTNGQPMGNQGVPPINKNGKKEKKEKNKEEETALREKLYNYLLAEIEKSGNGIKANKEKIIEFFNYKMDKTVKKEQYITEKGIDGLLRNCKECGRIYASLSKCIDISMEENWKAVIASYYKDRVAKKRSEYTH